MSSGVVVSQAQARSFFVTNQGLAEPFESPEQVVRQLFAVQTQYAASLGTAVAARVKRMKRTWPDDAINKNPTLFKTWSLRSTLQVHAIEDRPLVLAFTGPRYKWYLAWMRSHNLSVDQVGVQEARILEALRQGPMTRPEIHDAVPELKGLGWTGWGSDVKGLAYKGDLILAPSGEGPTRFTLASDWLGSSPDQTPLFEEAIVEILRRYLLAHGPVSMADFQVWCGIYVAPVKAAFEALKKEIVPVQIEGLKGTRYVLAEQVEGLQNAERASGVKLLAKFDPLLLSHKEKHLFVDPKFKKLIYQKAGQVEASVLIDGQVAGIWRISRKAKSCSIQVQPFRPLKPRELARLEKEAARVSKLLGFGTVGFDLEARLVSPSQVSQDFV